MNYEAGSLGGEPLAIEDPVHDARRRRRWIVIVAVAAVLAIAAYAWAKRGGDPSHVSPADQAPTVSVIVPGDAPVGRVINATGSLAAKRDMPVGVAGEGGMVTRVLVESHDTETGERWTTVGVSTNIIDASFEALLDSINYKLLKDDARAA